MKYNNLTLKSKLYSVDPQELVLKEKQIFSITLTPKFDGRTEKILFEKSILTIGTQNDVVFFELDKHGDIIEEHPVWIADHEIAKQELIIEKSKETQL
jgi:hypothetical protein